MSRKDPLSEAMHDIALAKRLLSEAMACEAMASVPGGSPRAADRVSFHTFAAGLAARRAARALLNMTTATTKEP